MKNYTLDECTYRCINYFVTAHPEDGQAGPKHIGATSWEKIYIICAFCWFFISSYTAMKGVEYIKKNSFLSFSLTLIQLPLTAKLFHYKPGHTLSFPEVWGS
jgi:hypothetical protein